MPSATDKTTILFLAANPVDTDPLRLSAELRDIQAAIRLAQHRDRFVMQDKWAVRIDDLRRAMLDYEDVPLILHFAGHGEAGALYLEADDGQARPIEGQRLKKFLKLFPNIKCVVLNACYSDTLADALVEVVPCVVGMEAQATDVFAVKFAVAFYDGVGAGRTYERAYDVAAGSLELEGGLDAVRPVFRQGTVAAPPPAPPDVGNGGSGYPPLAVPRIIDITGSQHGALADALADAYGTVDALGQMVRRKLNLNLNTITGSANIGTATFELVDWADRSGFLTELIQGALDTQPRNQKLRDFAMSVGAKEVKQP